MPRTPFHVTRAPLFSENDLAEVREGAIRVLVEIGIELRSEKGERLL